jgi:GNAT superfamily N-acetyltransferase
MTGNPVRLLDVHDDAQIADLTRLHAEYCAESLAAGHSGEGFAVAWYLRTALLYIGDEPVGYFSYDPAPESKSNPPAIELIYITPSARRRGLASRVVRALKDKIPNVQLKSPLTPACAAMAMKLGVASTILGASEAYAMRVTAREIRHTPAAWCRFQGHRRTNAFAACEKCTAAFPRRMAALSIDGQIALIRATGCPPGSLRTIADVVESIAENVVDGRITGDLEAWMKTFPEEMRPHIMAAVVARFAGLPSHLSNAA